MIQRLSQLQFINTAYNFPVDTSNINQPRQVPGFTFSEVQPEQKLNPRLIAHSKEAFQLINVDLDESDPENIAILAGNLVPATSKPVAHNYSGYQFGNWAGQLGDGRAILLGSVNGIEIQLKGAGLTPYSRSADGRAALRSSIREFLCSEAMHYLGIPTTRAASLVVTDTTCVRDMFYDGHPKREPAAVVARMAQSFLRFGSFEGDSQIELLKSATRTLLNTEDILTEITKRSAKLVAQWQNYGFCHGVLNTDNMSVLGLTIDYGPFAFMEYFDRQHICNHSDQDGRYSYENQPAVVQWNLLKLAQVLKEDSNNIQAVFSAEYKKWYYTICLQKLGLINGVEEISNSQIKLVDAFYYTLHETTADMHKIFRILMQVQNTPDFEEYDFSPEDQAIIQELVQATAPRDVFLSKRKPKITPQQLLQYQDILKQPHIAMMLGISQEFVNEQSLIFENYKKWENVSEELRMSSIKALWTDWLNQYKQHTILNQNLSQQMNPQFILTNKLLQEVIDQAEGGNYELLKQVQKGIEDPFNTKMIQICRDDVCVSCSS